MDLPNQCQPPPFPSQLGIPPARITKKAQPVKEKKSYGWVALSVFVVLVVFAVGFHSFKKRHEVEEHTHKWTDNVTCSAKCSLNGYSKPPLVLISFDGFSKDYLEQPGWVKWIKEIGDCGVKAEKVSPIYPSNTFVNHYAIVTGLYGESSGIVSNTFWDKELNPEGIESIGSTKNDKYFLREPIIQIDDLIKKRQQFMAGAFSMVYAEQPAIDEFLSSATKKCTENHKEFLLSTVETRPLRLHHTNSPRIAPLVVEGRPGVYISDSTKDIVADHGYDYLTKAVQTTFFAMGPSFSQGTVLPPFQNIEYLNLWLELLGIDPTTVKSNGTLGTMDTALKNAAIRNEMAIPLIQKCTSAPTLEVCCSTPSDSCMQVAVDQLFSSNGFCYETAETLCGKGVLRFNGTTRGVVEVIDRKMKPRCTVAVENEICSNEAVSLAADPSVDLISLRSSFPGVFVKEVFSALDNFLSALLKHYGRIVVLSGTAVDRNRDGLADSDQSQPPSHFFRLFLFCRGNRWSTDGLSCASPDQLDSRSFAFPVMETDPNCLKGVELLRYYSCRLRDIELVAGIEVVARGMNNTQRVQLRTKIDEDFLI